MNWMDIVVLLIIGGDVFRAFRQGMVKTVIELAGWLVALIAAKLYYKMVAAYMLAHFEIFKNLEHNVYLGLTKNFSTKAQLEQAASSGQFGGQLNFPKVLSSFSSDVINNSNETLNQMVFGDLAKRIADTMINGLSFMIIVFGIMAILAVVTVVVDQVMHLPLLKEANKLGGIVVGVVRGAFSVLVLMTVITFILPFMEKTWLMDGIQNSQIAIYFYNNNFLLYLIYYLLR